MRLREKEHEEQHPQEEPPPANPVSSDIPAQEAHEADIKTNM